MNTMKVTFVELPISDNTLPLASGYLQAYACKDELIASAYEFEHYSVAAQSASARLLPDLLSKDSDIYAFSCYVWNMGLIKTILPTLLTEKPNAQLILGGPQVMHHAQKYLDPNHENLVLCNGEGEKTFYDYLCVLLDSKDQAQPDFSVVKGLSYYRDGMLMTNPESERIRDLNVIPSPFLTGVFEGNYSLAVYETNRGCPFHCGFCYWGAANNDRVFQFDEERIRAEIEWLSRKGIFYLFLADANWGMLRRDIPLSQHIANCAVKYGTPQMVYYSAAKNKPDKVSAITDILHQAGVISSQPVSLQTMSEESLRQIDRKNIRLSAYESIQENLQKNAVSSFTELIWPLPGETLESYKAGINLLCAAQAGTIITYPHMLLHNTPLYNRRDEFGLFTKVIDKGVGEQEIVLATNDVDYQAYQHGVRFYFCVHLLHNMRTFTITANYLYHHANLTYSALFSTFADYLLQRQDMPIGRFFKQIAEEDDYYAWLGKLTHFSRHAYRQQFDELLLEFAARQPWWVDDKARMCFEIDLLNQPYFYSNTPFTLSKYKFEFIDILDVQTRGYLIALKTDVVSIRKLLPVTIQEVLSGETIYVEHLRMQMPYVEERGIEHNADHCHGVLMRIQAVLPEWKAWEEDLFL